MKRIRIQDLEPGMIAATDVYNRQDQLVLSAGTVLTEKIINRLSIYNIYFVRIKEVEKVEEGEVGQSYAEKVRNSEAFKEFHQEFDETVELMQAVISDFASNEVTMDAVNQVVDEAVIMIDADHKEFNVFDIVHNMRQSSDITYAHSINVAMICHTIAKWIGMSEEELENNLGTICESGSRLFKSENEKRDDIDIIGQFGVGFYSAFMVASKIEVVTRKYGSKKAKRIAVDEKLKIM